MFREGELVTDPELKKVFIGKGEVTLRVTIGVSAWYRKSYGSESHKQCRQFLDDIKKERPEVYTDALPPCYLVR